MIMIMTIITMIYIYYIYIYFFLNHTAETDDERKQEANSLMESFIQHAEYLESIKKGNNDVYAKSPTSSFHDVPMTPTYTPNTSSHNVFKLELPISKLRNSVVVND